MVLHKRTENRTTSDMTVSLRELHNKATLALADIDDGAPLIAVEEAFVRLGVAVSVTSLDTAAIDQAIAGSLASGATPAQVQEIVSLVSGLGVHSLMASCTRILHHAEEAGIDVPHLLTSEQQALWDRHVGADPFWNAFEIAMPGFLGAMLRLSPDQFVAFFDYCAVPWKSGQVRARVKELVAMASDATPAHRFLPGFRVHLANAIKLGAGRNAILRALAIAAEAPPHRGTR